MAVKGLWLWHHLQFVVVLIVPIFSHGSNKSIWSKRKLNIQTMFYSYSMVGHFPKERKYSLIKHGVIFGSKLWCLIFFPFIVFSTLLEAKVRGILLTDWGIRPNSHMYLGTKCLLLTVGIMYLNTLGRWTLKNKHLLGKMKKWKPGNLLLEMN